MSGLFCAIVGILAAATTAPAGPVEFGFNGDAGNGQTRLPVSGEIELAAGDDGTIDLAAEYVLDPVSTAPTYVWTQFRQLSGATWNPIGSEVQSTAAAYYVVNQYGGTPYPGFGSIAYTVTGLTPGQVYKFKLYARGSGNPMSGTVSGAPGS